jgi:hypothetical protein
MIFADHEKFTIPEKDKKFLKEKFPRFFSNDVRKSTSILFDFDSRLDRLVTDKHGANPHRIPPAYRHVSLKSKVEQNGEIREFVYSKKYEFDKNTEKYTFKDPNTTLTRGGGLSPGTDIALLWYLWFCSNEIANNANPMNAIYAYVNFHLPEESAKSTIAKRNEIAKVDSFLIGENQLEENDLRHFAIDMQEVDSNHADVDVLRVRMSDRSQVDPKYRAALLAYLEQKDSPGEKFMHIIGSLKTQGLIKHDGRSNSWSWMDEREVSEIMKTVKDQGDPDGQLARKMSRDSSLVSRMEDSVS